MGVVDLRLASPVLSSFPYWSVRFCFSPVFERFVSDNEYDGQLAKEGAGPAASGPGAVLLVHACASRESVRDRSSSRDRQLGWVGGDSRRSVRETLRRQVLALRQTQSHQPVHENGFDIVEVLLRVRVLQDGTCRTSSGRRSCHTVRPLDWPYLRKQKN